MKSAAALVLSMSIAGTTLVAQEASVLTRLSKDLAGGTGRELTMIVVEYPPVGSD